MTENHKVIQFGITMNRRRVSEIYLYSERKNEYESTNGVEEKINSISNSFEILRALKGLTQLMNKTSSNSEAKRRESASSIPEKHTPGRWAIAGECVTGKYITVKAAGGRTVARVPFDTILAGENGTATDDGDARLIAAAPEMLEALRRAEQQLDYGQFDVAQDILRAAIDKATGGNQS